MVTKVMCFGTFDPLHLGYIQYFEQARKYGDYLIVVVDRLLLSFILAPRVDSD